LETAIVGLAILANFNGKRESFEDIRIVLGAVAPTPKRALKAENLARGKRMNGNLLEEVTSIVSEESNPITDLRATAEYRKEMVKVLIQKGIQRIMNL
jgi:carbon-monoxide dehydrogenase medium subunit